MLHPVFRIAEKLQKMKTDQRPIRFLQWMAIPLLFLSSVVLRGQEDEGDVYNLSPFEISSKQDRGYGSANSLGASRVALANSDIASSIITLNEQLMQDVAAVDATDFLTYASGVQIGSDANPGQVFYSLRGYSLGGIDSRDGLPDRFTTADVPIDESTAYERIEIIKGPAGTLYGSHSMGGIVNKVTKWPLLTNFTKVQLQAAGGSDDFLRASIDNNSKLSDSTAIRTVLSYREGDRHFDEADAPSDLTNFTIAGSHYFENGGGKVWARFQYLGYKLDREQGWQYVTGFLTPGGAAPEVKNPIFPISRHANIIPEDDISIGNMKAYELGYEKNFSTDNSDWTLRLVARHNLGSGDKSPSYSQGRPVPVHATGQIVTYVDQNGVTRNGDSRYVSGRNGLVGDWRSTLTLRDFRGGNESTGLYADLHGSFETFGAQHDFVLNAQTSEGNSERAFFFWAVQNPNNTTAVANSFSAVSPNFTGINAESIKQNNTKQFNRFNGYSKGDAFAIGFQDNMKFMNDKLILVAGARYDDTSNDAVRFDVPQSIAQDKFVRDESSWNSNSANDTTYKVGLVGKPAEGVSLFAQHATTYNAVNTIDPATSKKFPNQEGEILEIGTKLNFFDNRLTATISWFDMELSNLIIQVINPPELGGGTRPEATGKQKTDGVEMDLAWQPTDNISLLLAVSDLDSTDANDRFFRGVPMDINYSVFGKYTFTEGLLSGYHAGLGYHHNAMAPGDSTNTFFLTDTDLLDFFVGYSVNNWSIQLNVYNVTGEDGILSSVSDMLAIRAPDTNYRMTARFSF